MKAILCEEVRQHGKVENRRDRFGRNCGAHIAGILASPDAEIWSICDANKEALAKRGEELNIPAARRYESYLRLLDDPELDAVAIATPNQSRCDRPGGNPAAQAVCPGEAGIP